MKRALLILLSFFFTPYFGYSQEHKVDFKQLIDETQINTGDSGELKIVWWIPVEFWELTFKNDNTITKEQVDLFLEILKPYAIFAVVDGKVGAFGGVSYTSADSLTKQMVLVDNENNTYKPLGQAEISADVQNFMSMFKPILKNMMGQLGENMHFFVFSDIKNGQKRISDPYTNGIVQLNIGETEYTWRTPLGALLPMKTCPVNGESLTGAWFYCPWHGKKLVEK